MYYTVYTTATCCTNCCCEKACRKARFGLFAPISPGEKSARVIAILHVRVKSLQKASMGRKFQVSE